jgi:hypothetical protein
MPKTSNFKPLWPADEYAVPTPDPAGNHGGVRGGADIGSSSEKETPDAFGPKVTTVEVSGGGGVDRGGKLNIGPETGGVIATPGVRIPTKIGKS